MTDDDPGGRQTLAFETDAGAARSKWIAGGLVVVLLGWMGSGFVLPSEEAAPAAETRAMPRAVAVAVRPSVAESVEQVFVAEGQALPDRDTAILAEASGRVAEVLVERGADVGTGEVIARLETAEREAELARDREALARARREFDNAETLLDRGVATADRVAEARAGLAAAQAALAAAEAVVEDTVIRAPFAGRIEALDADEGETLAAGAEVARIVDLTPLTIAIQIPQQSLGGIEAGRPAEVRFITGERARGVVRFVGSSADAETRTFTAEIEVPNEGGAVPAGVSAQVRIPTGEVVAHFVSPAILSLGTDGRLGVKTVAEGDVVEFHPVEIVRAQTDGIWVSGLPREARIIAVGQGYVNDGETVDPRPESEEAEEAPVVQAAPGGAGLVGAARAAEARTEAAGEAVMRVEDAQ